MKMRHVPGPLTTLLLFLAAMHCAIAAPINCATTGTYQDLINTNAAGGCSITINAAAGVSLLFSNFTFTPAGANTPPANQVGYMIDNPGAGVGGQVIYGFEFNPGLSVSGVNTVSDMLLTYTVVPMGVTLLSDHLLENASATGSGVAQVSENLTFCVPTDPNPTSGTCRIFPAGVQVTTAANPPGLSNIITFPPWSSMTVSKDIDVATGAAFGTASISQVRDAVDLSLPISDAPEPATSSLIGIGLVALGYLARRVLRARQRN